jgi:microcystin-dependent protein
MRRFNIATANGSKEVNGRVIKLYVGNVQEEFTIHDLPGTGPVLSHYGSGYQLTELRGIKVANMRNYSAPSDREAAKIYVDKLVAQYGADRVRAVMRSHPIINGADAQ